MIYDADTKTLYADDGTELKKLACPLYKNWERLGDAGEDSPLDTPAAPTKEGCRFCRDCEKHVQNLDGLSDDDAKRQLKADPGLCVYVPRDTDWVTIRGTGALTKETPCDLRMVQTARTVEAMNEAARHGFRPLVQWIEPNPEVSRKMAVDQNVETGEISTRGDYRSFTPEGCVEVIGWNEYHPHASPLPFAAYLVPPDIEVGETVYLEDLIEDVVASTWNQGGGERLESGTATWNGKEFEIDFDPEKDLVFCIG